MDSLGDYIYIIILAIAGISGLLKKKKNNADSPTAPTSTKKSWEDVLKQLTPVDSEIETYHEIAEPIPVKVEVPKVHIYETLEDSSNQIKKMHVSQISSNSKKTTKKEEITTEIPELAISFNSVEDARRAFIYTEIFNRKY